MKVLIVPLLVALLASACFVQALELDVAPGQLVTEVGGVPFDAGSGQEVVGYVARIGLNDPQQVLAALERAEALYLESGLPGDLPPITFILHGPEVAIFFKNNYQQYKPVVDLAARLSAFEVVDIKVCAARMRLMETDQSMVYPFVGAVVYGPRAIEELLNEKNYSYF